MKIFVSISQVYQEPVLPILTPTLTSILYKVIKRKEEERKPGNDDDDDDAHLFKDL